jgi:xanthine dehydrogenase YagS FAD-binding subunit
MYPFKVNNPTTVNAAAQALAGGKAAIIAGGTEQLFFLKAMHSPATPPETLVNLKSIPGLTDIKEEGNTLKIGALATLTAIANNDIIKSKYTALAQAAKAVASPELRNQGTIGGNICQRVQCWYYKADNNLFPCRRKVSNGPCYALLGDNRYNSIFGQVNTCYAVNPSDTAPALLALGAKIVTNKKTYNASEFWSATNTSDIEKTTVLALDEIVTEIQIPAPAAGTKSAFKKFALRKSFDFPIVNAAAVITLSGGTVSKASIALNAVHNLPRKATAAEDSINGKAINADTAWDAGVAALNGANAMPQTPANTTWDTIGNKYMIQIAKVLVKRVFLDCR